MTRSYRLSNSPVPFLIAGVLAGALGCASVPATPAPAAAPANASASATSVARPLVARAQPSIMLWAGGAPGALGADSTDQPLMTPYLPPAGTANGTAIVIFPGGGYQHLSMQKEGSDVANWLAGAGVTTFVVRYRLGPRDRQPTMPGDAPRPIRT